MEAGTILKTDFKKETRYTDKQKRKTYNLKNTISFLLVTRIFSSKVLEKKEEEEKEKREKKLEQFDISLKVCVF